jgi:hypothetical protein
LETVDNNTTEKPKKYTSKTMAYGEPDWATPGDAGIHATATVPTMEAGLTPNASSSVGGGATGSSRVAAASSSYVFIIVVSLLLLLLQRPQQQRPVAAARFVFNLYSIPTLTINPFIHRNASSHTTTPHHTTPPTT